MQGWLYRIQTLARKTGVRVTLIAAFPVLATLLAIPFASLMPVRLANRIGTEAVEAVLGVITSSMLAVTTFSLAVMVSARFGATGTATPRVARILREDRTTQTVLATFLGAFLFALIAQILLRAGVYPQGAHVVVFAGAIAIVLAVVVAILRWIDHLAHLGSLDWVIDQTARRAAATLAEVARNPGFGAAPPSDAAAAAAGWRIPAPVSGHVRFIDFSALDDCAKAIGGAVHVLMPPGRHVVAGDPILTCTADPGDSAATMSAAVRIGSTRTFDQDARHGLSVLAEIASRALSPGINDPGTAIEVILRLEELLRGHPLAMPETRHPRVHMAPVSAEVLMTDAFAPIARDGAGMIEVARALVEALGRIAADARQRGDTAMV